LLHGRIKLLTVVDLTGSSDSESNPTWKSYTYCKFLYPCDSMKKIESYADDLLILRWLPLSALPLTHRSLVCMRSASVMSGLIVGKCRVEMTSTSWLSTDEIQFLCAFLMRNKEGNTGFLHVLGPSITNNIFNLFQIFPIIQKNNATKTGKKFMRRTWIQFSNTSNQGWISWNTSFWFFCVIWTATIGCLLLLSIRLLCWR
jgi:hypothetical protein